MAKLRIGPLGVNGSVPSPRANRVLPKRQAITGWTDGAARRNRQFLQSIDPARLDGLPLALTLTLRDCPATPEEWQRKIDILLKWLRKRGMIRYHWVTEWQARGAPHLHAMVFLDVDRVKHFYRDRFEGRACDSLGDDPEWNARWVANFFKYELHQHWGCEDRGRDENGFRCVFEIASYDAQHVVGVTRIAGWCAYLAKHASRGVSHYQRQGGDLPPGWEKSGRLWAKGGDWPTSTEEVEIDHRTLDQLRRMLDRYLLADGRSKLAAGRRWGNARQVRDGKAQVRYATRRGSGRRMSEDVKVAHQLLARARRAGDLEAAARHLQQLREAKAESAAQHRRGAAVRGFSRHLDDRVLRVMLDAAMDHPEGYTSPWKPCAQIEHEGRMRARERRREPQDA